MIRLFQTWFLLTLVIGMIGVSDIMSLVYLGHTFLPHPLSIAVDLSFVVGVIGIFILMVPASVMERNRRKRNNLES